MVKNVFFIFCLLMLSVLSYGQEIFMKKTFGGVRYESDTLIFSSRGVLEILEHEPIPYTEFKLARKYNATSSILGFSGGLLIALPVFSAIVGTDPQWGLAGAGLVLIASSIPFTKAFTRHAKRAIDMHNQAFAARPIKTSFNFTGNGAHFVIRF